MKHILLKIAFMVSVLLFTRFAPAQVVTIDIQALIDGRDQLILRGNTLQWHHLDFAAVGRVKSLNEPTVITTALNGLTVMDHLGWIPYWPSLPPDEIRFEAFSSTFSIVTPSIPQTEVSVVLDIFQGREAVNIVQFPTDSNSFTTILEFNDNFTPGDANYAARLTYTVVPEPSALCLMTFLLVAIFFNNRSIQSKNVRL